MNAIPKNVARGRMKPEPHVQLLPVTDDQLERIDDLIEHLIALRDALDGDQDLEPEHHDGAAVFPGHALYDQTDVLATEAGPGDAADAEIDDEPEDEGDRQGVV